MATAHIQADRAEEGPACLSENPYRLVSLLQMLRFHASHFIAAFSIIGQLLTEIRGRGIPADSSLGELGGRLRMLHEYCNELGMSYSSAHIARMKERISDRSKPVAWEDVSQCLVELQNRVWDELDARTYLQVAANKTAFYNVPVPDDWAIVADRFKCRFDVEEARKCFALERFTASVFHLMKVVEHAVLDLQCFLDKPDTKAHFGGVLSKLDDLNRKTQFRDLPDHLKPYRGFLVDVLPQMHAVKDSWRNKVSHVDGKIVPVDVFTEEMASGVHDATLLLMKKLASGLPPRAV
jgi:hypothetical protein